MHQFQVVVCFLLKYFLVKDSIFRNDSSRRTISAETIQIAEGFLLKRFNFSNSPKIDYTNDLSNPSLQVRCLGRDSNWGCTEGLYLAVTLHKGGPSNWSTIDKICVCACYSVSRKQFCRQDLCLCLLLIVSEAVFVLNEKKVLKFVSLPITHFARSSHIFIDVL